VQSSRRLECEAGRNVEVGWLLGRLVPDHKTIADFRKDDGHAIRKVCARFVELCRELGLLVKPSVAIDGSKFKAVDTRDAREGRRAQLEDSVARYLSQLDTGRSRQRRSPRRPRGSKRSSPARREDAALGGARGANALAAPDQQISLTDPDSRSMATSGRGSAGQMQIRARWRTSERHQHLHVLSAGTTAQRQRRSDNGSQSEPGITKTRAGAGCKI
jgi:transposase